METNPKKTKANTGKANKNLEIWEETSLVKPLSKKHLSAVETYQALEDELTPEEKNSKIPLIIAFLSALALIVGLSIFLSQVSNYSWNDKDARGEKMSNDNVLCDAWERLVCGVNGLTYKNACLAENSKVIIAHDGECLTPTNDITLSVLTGSQWNTLSTESTWSTSSLDNSMLSSTGNSAGLSDDNDISSISVSTWIIIPPQWMTWSTSAKIEPINNTNIAAANVVVLDMNSYLLDPKLKIATYTKKEYNYSYSFPVATFFHWFIAPKWVTHEITLKSSSEPTSRVDSDVVVDFYRWKLLSELQWQTAVKIDSRYFIGKWDSTFVLEDVTQTAQSKKIIDTIIATLNY